MSWFVDGTYDVEVINSAGEKASVTLRKLNAGDQAAIHDSIAVSEDAAEIKLGTIKLLMVTRAVEKWDLPLAPTEASIKSLEPAVFDQIVEAVEFGGSPLGPSAGSKS